MTKKEVSILSVLIGIIIGMVFSFFLEYPITLTNLNKIIYNNCENDEVERINLSFLGKVVTVRCTDGRTTTYRLPE